MATKAKKKPAKKTAVTALAKPGTTKIKAKKTPAKAIIKKTNAKQLAAGPWEQSTKDWWSRDVGSTMNAYTLTPSRSDKFKYFVISETIDGGFTVIGKSKSQLKIMRCIDAALVALGYKLTGGIPKGVK